jgi:hypothetical protein
MINIAVLVLPLVTGILSGYLLRERGKVNLAKITLGIILVLIFSLGFSIGSNHELLRSIPRVGLVALGMSVLTIAFSVLFVVLIRRRVTV